MAYGTLSHNPWGVPKPECPTCKTNVNVLAKIRKKGGKVSWRCVCGMVSEECLEMPFCVWKVTANWLNDFYCVDYPLPESPYRVTWRKKGICERGQLRYVCIY
ncbi:hypothetical protein JVT61DRAFT_3662 [Boletus reticuloceps]|uniref:Uncharacterized protein n=1 Tax=Boletus reticuloceps TaxID=495285 RepID=A0A8I2YLG9_9AGAM|nr:hypothetical protein JVT61DRAFT_3662 [Boletus reticuloceps]